jgi:transcriptional regulator with XRE-family HTH domain
LAERAGVAPSTVYEAETGRRTPELESLKKIAAALGVKVADLLEEE